jgi:hypothetical protein
MLASLIAGIGIKTVLGVLSGGGLSVFGWFRGWHRKVGQAAKRVPSKAWPWIIGVVLAGALLTWHVIHEKRAAKKAVETAYAKGREDERAEAAKLSETVTIDMGEAVTPIAEKKRAEHEATLSDIRATADDLRLRGAGKAQCSDPAFSTGAGGHELASATGGAAVSKVPYPEWSTLIAMPVSSAIGIAESHDALLSEVKTWRSWHHDTYDAWEKKRLELSKPH